MVSTSARKLPDSGRPVRVVLDSAGLREWSLVRAVRLLRMPLWTLILLDLQANLLVGYEAMQRMRKRLAPGEPFEQRNGWLER